ncbi:MAG: hypothetical protein P8N48_03330 [Bacteroidales bacterium]|jgi:hypothetical protein|nr:hypothetical protein [Lentimicrobiaceae bacterium]MDG1135923.1 hypothetical protein [Bacteroidales bacterium]MDG1901865.1 hypothetical protein [Bacteroidales bacterium]MDG2080452.1 hypothetical protein [Bacteroidales bacterium]|tara:strand:+ start:19374 stop:19811 length:438 start_codon:yes stop_codon:yes gene_type:complete
MKNWIKVFILAGFVAMCVIAYVWIFVYNKPHRNYEKAKADYELQAKDCYYHFSNGAESADITYTGKVLEITGIPTYVEDMDTCSIIVFAYESGMFGDEGIRCSLLPKYYMQSKEINNKEEITIKGYCTGYNETDVIIEQCSLINR